MYTDREHAAIMAAKTKAGAWRKTRLPFSTDGYIAQVARQYVQTGYVSAHIVRMGRDDFQLYLGLAEKLKQTGDAL